MTLEDLITLYRADTLDQARSTSGGDDDVFCTDELLTIYANEGQDEACRRGQLLRDSSSPMCAISFVAGADTVDLDARVIRVLRAFVDGQPVTVISAEDMDRFNPGWQFQDRQDRPQRLVTGMTTGKLHFWPRPALDGALRITVQRLPLKPMRNDADKPEIRPELHTALVHWMKHRAYGREDTDMHNDGKAAVSLAKFEEEFGRKVSGRNEEWVRARESDIGPGPIA
ncbi:MAG: hypothetical protein LBJ15_18235 [Comamonas sp.]|jgi:hypothetical protein|uniref:phage adaptor protein n=1 Tax=Comamonas sp. TaxID=34028 RepID=UPI002837F14F|nr:DUF6682 family protein [Comamonas sp.]MDR0215916.1 hypothetical protein [Comamonas sp.]